MTCDECKQPINGSGYEMGSGIYCGTGCALKSFQKRQAEKVAYQKRVYVPIEKQAELARQVC